MRLRAGRRRYLGASAKKPIPGRADRLCCAAVRPFAVIRARLSQADRIETLLRDQAERISSLEARDPRRRKQPPRSTASTTKANSGRGGPPDGSECRCRSAHSTSGSTRRS